MTLQRALGFGRAFCVWRRSWPCRWLHCSLSILYLTFVHRTSHIHCHSLSHHNTSAAVAQELLRSPQPSSQPRWVHGGGILAGDSAHRIPRCVEEPNYARRQADVVWVRRILGQGSSTLREPPLAAR